MGGEGVETGDDEALGHFHSLIRTEDEVMMGAEGRFCPCVGTKIAINNENDNENDNFFYVKIANGQRSFNNDVRARMGRQRATRTDVQPFTTIREGLNERT